MSHLFWSYQFVTNTSIGIRCFGKFDLSNKFTKSRVALSNISFYALGLLMFDPFQLSMNVSPRKIYSLKTINPYWSYPSFIFVLHVANKSINFLSLKNCMTNWIKTQSNFCSNCLLKLGTHLNSTFSSTTASWIPDQLTFLTFFINCSFCSITCIYRSTFPNL